MTPIQQQRKKALFLYYELAGYFMASLQKFVEAYPVEAHVIRYPVNAVAPFKINSDNADIHFYERKEYSDDQLIDLATTISPDFIFCNGWSDKGYIAICRHFKGRVPGLVTFDNPWRNTARQNLARIVGPLFLKKIFTQCWVPGHPQKIYARKIGFKDSQIREGLYSADLQLFHTYYEKFREEKKRNFPKRFLFVGRYTKLKGVKELWEAFIRLHDETHNEWELWCIGKGDYDDVFPDHPKIKNFGFVQPADLIQYVEQTGVFILPSQYEHWGVVVHEFAAAGFPLMCSDTTSAAHAFLEDGKNGFLHKPFKVSSILETLRKFVHATDEELNIMAEHSVTLSRTITPDTWAATAWEYLEKN